MSRVGKAPIAVPKDVKVQIKGQTVKVSSSKGELEHTCPNEIKVTLDEGRIVCTRGSDQNRVRALHGLTRALLNNMVVGVSKGFAKELSFVGVGYKAKVDKNKLILSVGYSHPVEIPIEKGLTVTEADKKGTSIVIQGIDRQLVGEFAAKVRRVRPPEPYKGKGIRYKDEHVRTKAGKKVGA